MTSPLKAILLRLHWPLCISALLISLLGLWNQVGGEGMRDMSRGQGTWLLLGGCVFLLISLLDTQLIRRWSLLFYGASVGLLLLVLMIGKRINGSQRWIHLGAFSLQPSEVAKVSVILMVAAYLYRNQRREPLDLRQLIPLAGLIFPPAFLIFREPDLGQTLLLLLTVGTMILFESIERRTLWGLFSAGILLIPFAWRFLLHDYQIGRVLTLVDGAADRLGSGWHAHQAEIAVGHGGLFGHGHGLGSQISGGFLPEYHTDFVFAKLCEEHGFLGGVLLLSLYFVLLLSIIHCASHARDHYIRQLSIGVGALFFWHITLNIGMVLGLLPVTGVTLPLMSYGGSSTVTSCFALGVVMSGHTCRLKI